MSLLNAILDFFASLSVEQAFFWLFVQNLLQFSLCLFCGWVLVGLFSKHRVYSEPEPLSKKEVLYSGSCVLLNSLVALAGWCLWQKGVIEVTRDFSWHCLIDLLILFFMMDFLMYVTHRIVHIKGIYEIVHLTHHQYEVTRPLSLFVLNPFEVFGFGLLWLIVLSFYNSSWIAIVIYLLINAAFGTIGHIGVEPFPQFWLKVPLLRRLTTSTFHAQHHKEIESNFGFYTDIWDRLFGSINKSYQTVFQQASRDSQQTS